jgi:hypothetical protein
VTETKVGASGSRRRIVSKSVRSPSSVFGGKNSNEYDRPPAASRSRMVAPSVDPATRGSDPVVIVDSG